MGERIDLLLDLDLYIIIARTCVGNRCCIICITCITCVRIAGAAWSSRRTPASSAKWKAVPRCILWSPFFKALEKSRSAFSRLNFTDREHRAMNLLVLPRRNRWRWQTQAHVFTISGGDIYTRRTNRFY